MWLVFDGVLPHPCSWTDSLSVGGCGRKFTVGDALRAYTNVKKNKEKMRKSINFIGNFIV